MESPAPHTPLAALDLHRHLSASARKLFSMAADIELEPVVCCRKPDGSRNCYTALIGFSGAERGFLALSCSETLTLRLTNTLIGEPGTSAENYLHDVLGVTAAMLANLLLDATGQRYSYLLTLPSVVRSDADLLQQLLSDRRGSTCCFSSDEYQMMVKAVVTPANCIAGTDRSNRHPGAAAHQIQRMLTCGRCGSNCWLHEVDQ